MALSPSLRQLCEGMLENLDAELRRRLERLAKTGFSIWRAGEVVSEPHGLRHGLWLPSGVAIEVEGIIVAVLAGTMFRVGINQGKHQVLAHISGKMRKRFIRLVVGDRVKMEMSPYDMTKARITYRL